MINLFIIMIILATISIGIICFELSGTMTFSNKKELFGKVIIWFIGCVAISSSVLLISYFYL